MNISTILQWYMMSDPEMPDLLIRLRDFFENVKSDFSLLVKYYDSLIPDRPIVLSNLKEAWANLSPFLEHLINEFNFDSTGISETLKDGEFSAKMDFELAVYEMRRDDFYNMFYENIRKNMLSQNRSSILEKFRALLDSIQSIKCALESFKMPMAPLGTALQILHDNSGFLI